LCKVSPQHLFRSFIPAKDGGTQFRARLPEESKIRIAFVPPANPVDFIGGGEYA